MAVQKEPSLNGTIGNLIFYKRSGQTCVRVVPENVRQNNATKASAMLFGKASKIAGAFRTKLAPVIPFPADIEMQTRFISAIFQWIKADGPAGKSPISKLNQIRNFQFTTKGPVFNKRCKIRPKITVHPEGLLQILIPAFIPNQTIKAPAKTVSITLRLAAAGCDIHTGRTRGGGSAVLVFPFDATEVGEQIISLKFPMPAESLVLTAASVEYMVEKRGSVFLIKKKACMPAGILSAIFIKD